LGPNAFWTAMEAYFRPITGRILLVSCYNNNFEFILFWFAEADLQYIMPQTEKADDPTFSIPPLGQHYLQVQI
jgi:hypothetical protein